LNEISSIYFVAVNFCNPHVLLVHFGYKKPCALYMDKASSKTEYDLKIKGERYDRVYPS
jgi:hypothetical protein